MGRKQIDKLGEFVKTYKAKGLAWIALKENEIKSPISKFLKDEEMKAIIEKMDAKTGDLILIVADKNKVVLQSLGALRLEMAKELDILKDNKEFNFVWVTEFPLLSYDEEEKRFVAEHHPFTMPMDEDIQYLDSDPGRVRAKAYDIVLNGEELGGGSIRIHDTKLQEKMFEVLGFTEEKAWERFGFLLQAFKFGPPPHGGLAYGFDRMVMFLAGTNNIKDVIAFPKNQNAYCPMTEAPNIVDEIQLKELGINVK
jgi:aspartyl-tRNA synthetase